MANSLQARKRVRQTERQAEQNRNVRSKMRTAVKRLDQAIVDADKKTIGTQFPVTMSALHKAVSKGVLKRETAARKISRFSNRIKALSA